MPAARRAALVVFLICSVSIYLSIRFILMYEHSSGDNIHQAAWNDGSTSFLEDIPANISEEMLIGQASAPKLEDETLKSELGNAAWKLLHTITENFPDEPSAADRESLRAYLYLFARLYPCGECAKHFQAIMVKFPPQVSSRRNAAAWACHVHNEVNESLGKPLFDCGNIGNFYGCGCEDEDEDSGSLGRFPPLGLTVSHL